MASPLRTLVGVGVKKIGTPGLDDNVTGLNDVNQVSNSSKRNTCII